jgi:CBS domain-containing protein/nucleotide-binding universal stress UspA family protein
MTERCEHILVVIDFSRESDLALDLAVRLAEAAEAPLTAVHVIPAILPAREPSDIWESGETTTTKERERLQQHVEARLTGSPVVPDVDVLWGDRASQIAARARKDGSGLIVLGCAGSNGSAGSVAHEAPCPVVCVHPPGGAAESHSQGTGASAIKEQTVGDVMHRAPTTIGQNDVLADAKAAMARDSVHQLPVVDGDLLIGILSTRDLRAHEGYLDRTRVVAAMTQQPVTITPQATVRQAVQVLLKQKVNALPVVEGGRLVGIVSRSDLLGLLANLLERVLGNGGESEA